MGVKAAAAELAVFTGHERLCEGALRVVNAPDPAGSLGLVEGSQAAES